MEQAAKRNVWPPEKMLNTVTLRMWADFSYSSLRSELFSALHVRHFTGDRNDAQRHFLAFVLFFNDSVKKDGLFSF